MAIKRGDPEGADGAVARTGPARADGLTPREADVLRMLTRG
ncbi:hypothetical protein [Micromonospora sp. ATCC 39149]|nr:hypothetical protein [Micromonospora sp. ATCC 39149]